MRAVVILFLTLHALIHTLGFIQSFGLSKTNVLSTTPSTTVGILWLASAVLLLGTVIAWTLDAPFWWIVGTGAIILSQWLIFGAWSEAKFGTVMNLVLVVLVILGYSAHAFKVRQTAIREKMIAAAVAQIPEKAPNEISPLPAPVEKWLQNSGALQQARPDWITLNQQVSMKLSPTQENWYTAAASQVVSINPPAFQWVVQMRMNTLAYVYGQDLFRKGQGATLMKLWGLIPVANEGNNPQTNEAALQRYLAEMVWYPMAAYEQYVTWTAIDDHTARATITTDGITGNGVFHFNEAGEVVKFSAQRYREAGLEAERSEWIVTILETGNLAGVRVPLKAEISWQTPEGPWTWLEMAVTDLAYHHN